MHGQQNIKKNIKTALKDDPESVDWINMAQDRDQHQVNGNIRMNSITLQHITACDLIPTNLYNPFTLCCTYKIFRIRSMRKHFKGFGSQKKLENIKYVFTGQFIFKSIIFWIVLGLRLLLLSF
jgi:hypothetical protein